MSARWLIAAGLFIALSACGGSSSSPDAAISAEFTDFETGQTMTLGDFSGTPLVVNLWAPTCPSCIHEMPDFEAVSQELEGEVVFVGLSVDGDRSAAEDLVEQTGVTYQLGVDEDNIFTVLFEVVAMPTTAFITAEGQVAEVRGGQLSADALREQIDRHLLGDTSVQAAVGEVDRALGSADQNFDPEFLSLGGEFFPAIEEARFVSAAEATWMDGDEVVMGAVAATGEAQAYPVDQMSYHHIANSELGGEPFLVTY